MLYKLIREVSECMDMLEKYDKSNKLNEKKSSIQYKFFLKIDEILIDLIKDEIGLQEEFPSSKFFYVTDEDFTHGDKQMFDKERRSRTFKVFGKNHMCQASAFIKADKDKIDDDSYHYTLYALLENNLLYKIKLDSYFKNRRKIDEALFRINYHVVDTTVQSYQIILRK